MNKLKIYIHLLTLPRWFALPAVVAAIALGGILMEVTFLPILLAILSGMLLMAGAHSFNTYLDYVWTKLDQGGEEERSRPKEYTVGQQPIAAGLMNPPEVLANALGWYALSIIPAIILTVIATPYIWIPWVLSALSTFYYSYGKLHYQCEFALGLGFGPFAVMLGACASPNPNLGIAFLAGLPFLILWGFLAEFVDQATDAEVNWNKGLRNLGAWAWKNNVSIPMFTGWLLVMTFIVQFALVLSGILSPLVNISLISFPLFAYGMVTLGEKFSKQGVLLLLVGVFVHMVTFVVGQGIGGL